jgi:AraC family transcriptional regulator, positive regulator of tynA and feaB
MAMTLESISIEHAPPAGRPAIFRQIMEDRFSVGLRLHSDRGKSLATDIKAYCGRRLQFASLALSPHRASSEPLDGGKAQRLMVTMQDEGTAMIRQDGRECELSPGKLCVMDPARELYIETSSVRIRSLYLSRPDFEESFPQVDAVTARTFDTAYGPGAIFRSMFDEMFRLAPTLDEQTADSFADALPFVLATFLHSVKTEHTPYSGSKLRLFHKQRIRRYARGSLRNPRLTAQDIAAGVNLSARYVFELFSDEEMSLMKWVWSERLQRCKRDLSDAVLRGKSVGEIAYNWGFSDMAHFSRSFKRKFRSSPRQFRTNSLA